MVSFLDTLDDEQEVTEEAAPSFTLPDTDDSTSFLNTLDDEGVVEQEEVTLPGEEQPTMISAYEPTIFDQMRTFFKDPAKEGANATIALVDSKMLGISPSQAMRLRNPIDRGVEINPAAAKIRKSLTERLGSKLDKGYAQVNSGLWNYDMLTGTETPEVMEGVKQTEEYLSQPEAISETVLEDAVGSAAEMFPFLAESAKHGGWRGIILAGGTMLMGTAAGVPEAAYPLAAPMYAVGQTSASLEFVSKVEAGLAYSEIRNYKDPVTGEQIDPNVAKAASFGVGAINGLLEYAQLKTLVKTIPGGKKLLSGVILDTVKEAVEKKGLQGIASKYAQQYGKTIVTETLQETAQESVNITADIFSRKLTNALNDTDLSAPEIEEIVNRLAETAKTSAQAFAVMGVPGSVVSAGYDVAQQRKVERAAEAELQPEMDVEERVEQVIRAKDMESLQTLVAPQSDQEYFVTDEELTDEAPEVDIESILGDEAAEDAFITKLMTEAGFEALVTEVDQGVADFANRMEAGESLTTAEDRQFYIDNAEAIDAEIAQRTEDIPASIGTAAKVDGLETAAQINEVAPGNDVRYDGEMDLSMLGKPNLYQFTAYEGPAKGATFMVEELTPDAVQTKLNQMIALREDVPGSVGLYSAVGKSVEGMDFKSIPPKDLANRLKKTQGLKAEEFEDLGLMDWLDGVEGKVSKDQVLEFIQKGGPQLEEVTKTKSLEITEEEGTALDETKYADYTLPGGENYREVVVTVPDAPRGTPPDVLTELPEGYDLIVDRSKPEDSQWGVTPPGQIHARPWAGSHAAQEKAKEAALEKINHNNLTKWREQSTAYKSSHWDESNVLAHYRLQDMVTEDGKKTLLIEEIQSDWHQEGRKKGYTPSGIDEARTRLAELRAIPLRKRTDLEQQELGNLTGDIVRASTSVPDAPFKKSWPMLAFRKILQEAVEKGYDSVSWTPGQTQADRYDLSKHVDAIRWYNNPDDTYNISYDKDGTNQVAKNNVPAEELEDIVGKDLAKKIVENAQDEVAGTMSGLDLKVGGEGMIGFYDKILPKEVGKYIKKLDKSAKVGATKISDIDVWTVPLTDKLVDKITTEGQPIYAAVGPTKVPTIAQPFHSSKIAHQGLQEAVESGLLATEEGAIIDGVMAILGEKGWGDYFDVKISGQKFTPSAAQLEAHGIPQSKAHLYQLEGALLTETKQQEIKDIVQNVAVIFQGGDVTTFFHEFGEFAYKRLLTDTGDKATVSKEYRKSGSKQSENEWFSDNFRNWWVKTLAGDSDIVSPELHTLYQKMVSIIKEVWQRIKSLGTPTPAIDELFTDIIVKGREVEFGTGELTQVAAAVEGRFENAGDGNWYGYKVMQINDDGDLVSGANSRLKFENKPGAEITMPGDGVFLSNSSEYVMDYYSGLADNETLLKVKFDENDIVFGKSQFNSDREPEIGLSKVTIVSTDEIVDGEIVASVGKTYNIKEIPTKSKKDSGKRWDIEIGEDYKAGFGGLIKDVKTGEAGGKTYTEAGVGGQSDIGGFGTTYPEFMRDKGWTGVQVENALQKAIDGKPLGITQVNIIESAIEYLDEMERMMVESEQGVEKSEQDIIDEWGEFFDHQHAKEPTTPAEVGKQPAGLREYQLTQKALKEQTGQVLAEEDAAEQELLRFALKKAAYHARKAHSEGNKAGVIKEKKRMAAILARAKQRKADAAAIKKVKEQITEELKRAKIKKKDGKPQGRYGAERQKTLDQMRAWVTGKNSLTKAQARLVFADRIQKLADSDIQIPSEFELIENKLLALMGSPTTDIDFATSLLEDIKAFKATGETQRLRKSQNRIAYHEVTIDKIVEIVGGVDPVKRQIGGKALPEDKPLKQRIRNLLFASGGTNFIQAWDDLLDILSYRDKTSKPGESVISKFGDVHDQENAEKQGNMNEMEALQEMVMETYGLKNTAQMTKLFDKDSVKVDLGTFKDLNGNPVPMVFTKSEARKTIMALLDPSLYDTFFSEKGEMHWSQDMVTALYDMMTPQDLEFIQKQMSWYQGYYDSINDVYKEIYGVNLPSNPFYSPISREGVNKEEDAGLGEFMKDAPFRASASGQGSIKSRTVNYHAISQQSDIAVLQKHVMEMEHFKAWSQKIRDLNAVFNHPDVRASIAENFGQNINQHLEDTIQALASGGNERSNMYGFWDKIRIKYTQSVLAVKPSLFVKQLSSTFAFADAIPTAYWTKEFTKVLMPGNLVKATKELFEGSAMLRHRWGQGAIERDIAAANKTDEYKAFKASPSLMNKLMFMVRLGDMSAIIAGGYPVYKYYLDKTGSKKEAIRHFESVTSSAQQSSDLSKQSSWQRGNAIMKLFTMFKTSPTQYLRKEIAAVRNLAAGRISSAQFMKTIIIYHFILPLVFQTMSEMIIGGDDDEDALVPFLTKGQKRAMFLGSFNGLFIVGDGLDYMLKKMLGIYADLPTIAPNGIWRDLMKAMKLFDWNDLSSEEVLSAVRGLAGATGAATGGPGKQVVDIGTGVSDVLAGEWEKGIMEMMGWSPTIAEKATEDL